MLRSGLKYLQGERCIFISHLKCILVYHFQLILLFRLKVSLMPLRAVKSVEDNFLNKHPILIK